MALHERARISGIRFQVQNARGMRVQDGIPAHLFEGRQADDAPLPLRIRYLAVEFDDSLCGGSRGRGDCETHEKAARDSTHRYQDQGP